MNVMALKERVMPGQVEPGAGKEELYPVLTYCAALLSLEQYFSCCTTPGSGFPTWISTALEIAVLVGPSVSVKSCQDLLELSKCNSFIIVWYMKQEHNSAT